MDDSILQTIKKMLGIEADYTHFDMDIMIHINSVFGTLHQIGAAPLAGFYIDDEHAKWSDFYGPILGLREIKTYVYLRVKALFDPPSTGYAVEAVKEQIKELEWRLSIQEIAFNPNAYTREEVIPDE